SSTTSSDTLPEPTCSSRPPLPPLADGGDAFVDRDGLPQEFIDELIAKGRSSSRAATSTKPIAASSTRARTIASTTAPAEPLTPPPASAVQPVPCYNFDARKYGYCCATSDNPCKNDRDDRCWFGGEGVSGGASNVLPNFARCPPPRGARYRVPIIAEPDAEVESWR
ncbi:hypothetical protein CH063_08453, partial [Colletotrichum higginsianum]